LPVWLYNKIKNLDNSDITKPAAAALNKDNSYGFGLPAMGRLNR